MNGMGGMGGMPQMGGMNNYNMSNAVDLEESAAEECEGSGTICHEGATPVRGFVSPMSGSRLEFPIYNLLYP